jgi:hypothetical protein
MKNKKYDIVIVSHEKDFNNIKFIVEHAQKNLEFESVHLILSEREEYQDLDLLKTLTDKPVYKHKESDILKIDRSRIKHRPNWIYQMLLKIFQNVTENDNFLIIESDCIILKKLDFFENDKTTFYLCRDQDHLPYFEFSNKILGIGREYNHSFISEFIMYDKEMISDLLRKCNCNDVYDFLELIYDNVTPTCYPADYELYGNFCYKFHPDKFQTKNLEYHFEGRDWARWTDPEILNLIRTHGNKDVMSFHVWGMN